MSYKYNDPTAMLKKAIAENIEKAITYLAEQIKLRLNTSQPYKVYHGKGEWYHGLDPSLPGESPKKIRGDLQRSIAYEMAQDREAGRVGTNLEYGKYLETGTSKMAARPFFRTTINAVRETLKRIVETGKR